MSRPACEGVRKDGAACRAPALPGSRLCWSHDPRQAEQAARARAEGASKGGKLRSIVGRRSKLATAEQVLAFNADVVHRVLSGELAVDVARCAIYGLSLQRQLIESSDLEQRLAVLEAAAG